MLLGAVALTGCSVSDPASAPAAAAPPQTEDEKLMYFIGANTGRYIEAVYQLTDDDKALAVQGFREALAGEALVLNPAKYSALLEELAKTPPPPASSRDQEEVRAFLEEAAAAEGAQVMDSGLIFVSITEGSGESPTETDIVRVHYHGTLWDGTVFDSSVERGTPVSFMLNTLVPCWTEGMSMMKVGGKAALVCPPEIAYGERGASKIPGGAALKFEVELLEIVDPEAQ